MTHEDAIPDPEQTLEELRQSKRVADRAILVGHIDYLVRPPAWVYDEIEEAIRRALAGELTAEIESRDGRRYVVADLVERWELDDDLLEVYARTADDPSYRAW